MRKFKKVATFTLPSDLAVAKSLLESENIECYVKNELTVQVHNFYSNAIGGIDLEVKNVFFEQAIEILTEKGFESEIIIEIITKDVIEKDNDTIKYIIIAVKVVVTFALLFSIAVICLRIFYK